MKRLPAILLLAAAAAFPATRLLVTVTERRTGKPISGLSAADFTVTDDRTARVVEAAESSTGLIDVMLLLDTSLVGEAVGPVALSLIDQLQDKEQMAVVSFASSAELIQDFTSSKDLLRRSLNRVKYGNSPRVLDALYAAIDTGFEHASARRVLVLLTAGFEGPSRTEERDVIRLARRNGISIHTVYMVGAARSLFEKLAQQTGGATFSLRDLDRAKQRAGPRVFEVLRTVYLLTLKGNLALSERMKVEVRRPERLAVSALPLE